MPVSKEGGGHLLTVQDVAAWLSVPVSWVYAKAAAGELPSIVIGRRYRRFDRAEIAEYIAARRQRRAAS